MSFLFKIACQNRKHYFLLFFTILSLIGLTIASQLEVVSLGVMTSKGADFFQLFGRADEDGVVYLDDLQTRFQAIDADGKGYVSTQDTRNFMNREKYGGWLGWCLSRLERYFDFSDNFVGLALFLLCVALFKGISLFFHRFTTRLVAIRVSRDLRQSYFEHIQMLPMRFYQQYDVGSLSARVVSDATSVAEAINSALINYLQTPLIVFSSLVLCFVTSWKLSLIIFCGFPIILFPILFLAKRVKRISRQILKNQESFTSVLIDYLAGVMTVKVFAMEEFSLRKYQEHNQRMAQYEEKSGRYDIAARPILHFIGQAFLATAILYGLYVERMAVSEILVYCGLLYFFYEPIKKFAEENNQIQKGVAAAERMFEVLRIQPPHEEDGQIQLKTLKNSIEFRNVTFGYEEDTVLHNISFTVEKGQKVAICGATGAGKSTLAQLLPRLYEVEGGQILIDGEPIQNYTRKSLREAIAFVPQKPFLFIDTVAENIAFGRPFSEEQIKHAAMKAHADEFISCLPNGYQTYLLESGKNLSGGQQQRVAIARALIKNAPILVLDEATSSLDAVSENLIRDALTELRGDVTQIIIAHRLSTIEDADKIIFLEGGHKIAEGTKEEVLASCPQFRMMWQLLHNPDKVSA